MLAQCLAYISFTNNGYIINILGCIRWTFFFFFFAFVAHLILYILVFTGPLRLAIVQETWGKKKKKKISFQGGRKLGSVSRSCSIHTDWYK